MNIDCQKLNVCYSKKGMNILPPRVVNAYKFERYDGFIYTDFESNFHDCEVDKFEVPKTGSLKLKLRPLSHVIGEKAYIFELNSYLFKLVDYSGREGYRYQKYGIVEDGKPVVLEIARRDITEDGPPDLSDYGATTAKGICDFIDFSPLDRGKNGDFLLKGDRFSKLAEHYEKTKLHHFGPLGYDHFGHRRCKLLQTWEDSEDEKAKKAIFKKALKEEKAFRQAEQDVISKKKYEEWERGRSERMRKQREYDKAHPWENEDYEEYEIPKQEKKKKKCVIS